jgi:hypothetical protein
MHDFSLIAVKIHKPPVIVMNRPAMTGSRQNKGLGCQSGLRLWPGRHHLGEHMGGHRRGAESGLLAGESGAGPVKGGITNANFMVQDRSGRYFVRVGADIPIHGVMRFNEMAASRAAAACGLSPEVVFQAPGALASYRFIEAKTLSADDVSPACHAGAHLPLLRRVPPRHAAGAARTGPDLLGLPWWCATTAIH